MVAQTRQMVRSASRSALIQSMSCRHQTRSVVRATASLLSSSANTPPPSIPASRKRKPRNISLAVLRERLHRKNKRSRRHKPGYHGERLDPRKWEEFRVPDKDDAEEARLTGEEIMQERRKEEIELGVPRTPAQWLDRRMERTETPSDDFQVSKRKQLAAEKAESLEEGKNLNTQGPYDHTPRVGSMLSSEVGWKWRGESLYHHSRDA